MRRLLRCGRHVQRRGLHGWLGSIIIVWHLDEHRGHFGGLTAHRDQRRNQPVERLDQASTLDDAAAEIVLAEVAARPDVFVNPYLVEVQDRAPSGRDRLKERIRAAGPTVGHSVAGGVG